MGRYHNIVILTGSGISAESGISTFRDTTGIWAKYDFRDVATPEGFARDPALVLDFYNMRRRAHHDVQPNLAHAALARLEREHRGIVTLVTQNVDALHEAAGSRNLIHMHGEVFKALCARCGARHAWRDEITLASVCPSCQQPANLRPDVVWFGEMPYRTDEIMEALATSDLFVSIGTSGTVYPAAGFVEIAKGAGATTVELNLEPSVGNALFDHARYGPATEIVPTFVEEILAGKSP